MNSLLQALQMSHKASSASFIKAQVKYVELWSGKQLNLGKYFF